MAQPPIKWCWFSHSFSHNGPTQWCLCSHSIIALHHNAIITNAMVPRQLLHHCVAPQCPNLKYNSDNCHSTSGSHHYGTTTSSVVSMQSVILPLCCIMMAQQPLQWCWSGHSTIVLNHDDSASALMVLMQYSVVSLWHNLQYNGADAVISPQCYVIMAQPPIEWWYLSHHAFGLQLRYIPMTHSAIFLHRNGTTSNAMVLTQSFHHSLVIQFSDFTSHPFIHVCYKTKPALVLLVWVDMQSLSGPRLNI